IAGQLVGRRRRQPDEALVADVTTGIQEGNVPLPDMNAVGTAALDEVGPVVEHEERAVRLARPAERLRGQHELVVRQLLVAQLDEGATQAAAGVLAPDPETPGFTVLARSSAGMWPAFADELGEVGYTRCGSLVLAFDEAELADGWLDGDTCRALEPGISAECV